MSNLRTRALQYIAELGGNMITVEEIAAGINEPERRIRQAMTDAKKEGLVSFGRDEIVNIGGYSLTVKGHNYVVISFESKTQPEKSKGQILAELLADIDPMTGSQLAKVAHDFGHDIQAKSVPSLLATKMKIGEIVSRPYRSTTLYMTAQQAEVFDASRAAPAHVMSAPNVEELPPDDDSDEPPPADAAWLAAANRELDHQLHTLKNDVAAAKMVFAHLCEMLAVQNETELPAVVAALLESIAERKAEIEPGRLALAMVEPGGTLDTPQYFEPYVTVDGARQVALNTVDDGDCDEALVLRVLGRAIRKKAEFTPEIASPLHTLHDSEVSA